MSARDFLSEHVAVIPVVVPPAPAPRHEPTDDCDGLVLPRRLARPCPECGARLCSCEMAYGHDCEVT